MTVRHRPFYLPIFTDELARARKEYDELQKSGKKGTPVWKQVLSSLFSWQDVYKRQEKGSWDWGGQKPESVDIEAEQVPDAPVLTPVSYTHLDVYKRQFFISSSISLYRAKALLPSVCPDNEPTRFGSFTFLYRLPMNVLLAM